MVLICLNTKNSFVNWILEEFYQALHFPCILMRYDHGKSVGADAVNR